jgi:uncharacterized membrane protein YcaP (DUF421 family)
MDLWESLLGSGEDLSILQMSFRALIIYFATLVLIRVSGIRILARKSALDNIIMILLGAVLARAIEGASPIPSAIAAAAVIVVLNKIINAWSLNNKTVGKLCKGSQVILYEDGMILYDNLKKVDVSKNDLMESLRLETNGQTFEKVAKATLETNGRISFVLKE